MTASFIPEAKNVTPQTDQTSFRKSGVAHQAKDTAATHKAAPSR